MRLTLDEFIKKELRNLNRFKEYWKDNYIKHNDHFIINDNIEWYEEYESFLIRNKNEKR